MNTEKGVSIIAARERAAAKANGESLFSQRALVPILSAAEL